ncbi:hypothetical protein [Microbacterium sp. Bi128]|uniref:hypothetical protein n=1 Tax=Microbacterium sp. Bi128 TaxID=2821115 RepID=UPI001E5C2D7B|nr:hypothetical protein [Microbacterium sp. Bi128]
MVTVEIGAGHAPRKANLNRGLDVGVDEDRDKVDGADLDADLGAGTDAGRDADGDLASAPQEACSLDRIVEDLLWESDRES